jgi:hypothetical protein
MAIIKIEKRSKRRAAADARAARRYLAQLTPPVPTLRFRTGCEAILAQMVVLHLEQMAGRA